jgi:glyoxalase family protein
VRGETRGGLFVFDSAPVGAGIQGAGTVHHVAWASSLRGHESWHQALVAAGAGVTPVVDRSWFRSFYFREPSGVLFEVATIGPGFGIDEAAEQLGRHLVPPPPVEQMRDEIEPALAPLPDPRASRVGR